MGSARAGISIEKNQVAAFRIVVVLMLLRRL